jgi:hypothetical protein
MGRIQTLGFAGYTIDPRYAKVRGEDEARQLKEIADREYERLLKGYDVELAFEAWGPRDFNPADQVTLRGQSKTTAGPKSHYVDRRIEVPLAIRAVLAPAGWLTKGIGLFSAYWKEASEAINQYRAGKTTESVEAFVNRAFTQVKQEIDAGA